MFGFPCDICRVVLCRDCAGLSTTEVRFVAMATRAVPYLCKECIGSLQRVPLLERRIQELEHEVQELREATKSSKQSYADILKANIDSTDQIKETVKNLEKRVEDFRKQDNVNTAAAMPHLEPAVHELQERELRAANILIFGVRESDGAARDERIEQENRTVEAILRKIDGTVTREIKVRRLGRYE